MTDPLFWLVISLLFVTVSLTIVLAVAVPALKEVARAARSAEKLFDTLQREFPPTLQSIRLTGMEISDLTGDVSQGVQSAGSVVKQVDTSITQVKQQAKRVHSGTRSVFVGMKAAWRTLTNPQKASQRSSKRLPPYRPEASYETPYSLAPEYRVSFPESYNPDEGNPYSNGDSVVSNGGVELYQSAEELRYVELSKDSEDLRTNQLQSEARRSTEDSLPEEIT